MESPENVPPGAPELESSLDFLKKRVETLEHELSLEREHKESRHRAQGRVEALEKRLDEMNGTFAQLLKEAVARHEAAPSTDSLIAEITALRGALTTALDNVNSWRGKLREIASVLPQVQGLAQRIPENEKQFHEVVSRRLDDFSSHITRLLDDWKHALDGERSKLDDRLEAMSRERSDLSRSWEMQTRSQREEQFKERQTRENEFAKQVAMLSAQITDLAKTRRDADPGQKAIEENLQRILSILTQTPQAKDLVVLQLETEKAELIKAIKERHEALQEFAQERRDVEKSMGDGLMALTRELEEERARTRAEQARGNARQGEIDKLNGRLADLEQAVTDRDMRIKHLIAEREDLAHALATEADKVHAGHKERLAVVNAIELQMTDLRKQLEEETTRRTAAEGAATMARSQMNALAEQTARSLQERDTIVARFSDWEKERQRLAEIIRKKDEMIGLLSSTFSGALKKGT